MTIAASLLFVLALPYNVSSLLAGAGLVIISSVMAAIAYLWVRDYR